MNRKLHNSLMALSTTGLLLVVGLMAATPVADPAAMDAPLVRIEAADPETGTDTFEREIEARTAAAIEARARTFEEEFRNAGDPGEAIALTAAFVAGTATEAALSAAFGPVKAEEADAQARTTAKSQRKRRSTRSALALPYFSFARGLRGGNGG